MSQLVLLFITISDTQIQSCYDIPHRTLHDKRCVYNLGFHIHHQVHSTLFHFPFQISISPQSLQTESCRIPRQKFPHSADRLGQSRSPSSIHCQKFDWPHSQSTDRKVEQKITSFWACIYLTATSQQHLAIQKLNTSSPQLCG